MTRLFAFILTFVAGPALALSCLPADVANSYFEAATEGEPAPVVYGTLTFDSAETSQSDLSQTAPETIRLPARFDGKLLNRSGFETDFSQDVMLELACFGPWCGQVENGQSYLAFLQKHGSDYVLVVDPCSMWLFAEPSDAQLDLAVACMRGTCVPGTQ